MQPEGSRRHRYSSNVCGNRAFLRTESHTARRGSCFLFFYTRPQIVITILFFFNATNTSCCICADKSYQRQACAARDPRLARYEMSRETDPCLFGDGTSPIWKKPSMHPYPTKLRFRFPGSSAVSFFPLLRPLYYSLRTFSLAVFVHRFFLLFLRLFSSFSSLDIRFLHLQ